VTEAEDGVWVRARVIYCSATEGRGVVKVVRRSYVEMDSFQEALMLPTLQDLGIDRLSVDDRIALAQAIWDSLPAQPRLRLSPAKQDELSRRAAEDDVRPEDVVPWEQVKAGILDRLGRL